MRRILLAMAVTAALAGCGGSQDNNDSQQESKTFQNATITRNPDSTFTLKSGDQTLGNISSFKVSEQQPSKDVQAFLAAPEDSGGGSLCCNSCSLSGGVLICTGCVKC